MNSHELKTIRPYFDLIVSGIKTFEVRKDDGRDFRPGDILWLREHVPTQGFTGRSITKRVVYLFSADTGHDLAGTFLTEGTVVMGLGPCGELAEPK